MQCCNTEKSGLDIIQRTLFAWSVYIALKDLALLLTGHSHKGSSTHLQHHKSLEQYNASPGITWTLPPPSQSRQTTAAVCKKVSYIWVDLYFIEWSCIALSNTFLWFKVHIFIYTYWARGFNKLMFCLHGFYQMTSMIKQKLKKQAYMKEFQQHYSALKCDIILNLFWLDLLDFPNVMETDVSLYKAHNILEPCTCPCLP